MQFEKFDDLGESYNQGSVARKESAKPAEEADKTFNDRGSPLPDLGATQRTVMQKTVSERDYSKSELKSDFITFDKEETDEYGDEVASLHAT